MLPDTMRTGESQSIPCNTPRSQLRNVSTRVAPSAARSIRLRKIGSSSITRRTRRSCWAQPRSSRSPWSRQFPAFNPARIFKRTSCTLTSSTAPTARRDALAARLRSDRIGRTGYAARAMSAITSSGQVASSTSVNSVTHPPALVSRRPSSRMMLVLPMRRWPVSSTWLPSRTRCSRMRSSRSRSKKSSPLTQRPVEDFKATRLQPQPTEKPESCQPKS